MPRLSLYRPEKGNDFKFLDRVIEEQFQVGGTDVYVHKYIGPVTETSEENTPGTTGQTSGFLDELSIQDVILMENRDRKYDENIYVMRTIYQMQDLDFNLSQFGIFLNNDNIFLHFHLRNTVGTLQRKIMAGDVIELPHLKDEYALGDEPAVALKRFYVVQEVMRPSNGFSQTWYPHLLRAKCVPLVDTQEYADILDRELIDADGNPTGSTIGDLISNKDQALAINNLILEQAEADAPLSGYDTKQLYVLPTDGSNFDETLLLEDTSRETPLSDLFANEEDAIARAAAYGPTAPINPVAGGKWYNNATSTLSVYEGGAWKAIPVSIGDTYYDGTDVMYWTGTRWTANHTIDTTSVYKSPTKDYYVGYLTGDGTPPNGAPYSFGISFPTSPVEGQFHLRTDYYPNRLFRWNGTNWMKFEDNVRMTLTNSYDSTVTNNVNVPQENIRMRQTQRTGFINNNNTATIAGKVVEERQALSQVLKPKADN